MRYIEFYPADTYKNNDFLTLLGLRPSNFVGLCHYALAFLSIYSSLVGVHLWFLSYDFSFLMISAVDQPTSVSRPQNGTTGWELALVTAPSSNESASATSKLVKPYLKISSQFTIMPVHIELCIYLQSIVLFF